MWVAGERWKRCREGGREVERAVYLDLGETCRPSSPVRPFPKVFFSESSCGQVEVMPDGGTDKTLRSARTNVFAKASCIFFFYTLFYSYTVPFL